MKLAVTSRVASAALLALAACTSQAPDGDAASPDGTSDGKPLVASEARPPPLRASAGLRHVMRPTSALTSSAAPNAKLKYFGGQVVENPLYVNVFWGAHWSGPGAAERSYMNAFAQQVLPTSEFLSAMVEYTGPNGKTIKNGRYHGEALIGGEPGGSAKKITDDQVRAAIDSWIQAGLVPAPSPDVVYPVHFPPGVQIVLGSDA